MNKNTRDMLKCHIDILTYCIKNMITSMTARELSLKLVFPKAYSAGQWLCRISKLNEKLNEQVVLGKLG